MVYPNPTSDELYIEHGDQLKDLRIEMVNAVGKKVISQKVNQQEAIDLRPLPGGIYFYRLLEKDELVQSGKVVIER